jgi:hypothetical protein
MSLDGYPVKSNEAEAKVFLVTYQGAGAAVMTTDNGGRGMTLTRDGVGVFTITWTDLPGNFLGWSYAIGGTTPTDVDGYTIVREQFVAGSSTTDASMQFNILTEGQAAHDLSTTEVVDLQLWFQSTGA